MGSSFLMVVAAILASENSGQAGRKSFRNPCRFFLMLSLSDVIYSFFQYRREFFAFVRSKETLPAGF